MTRVAIALYEGLTLLDAIGPYQVLTLVPGLEVVVCAERTGRLSDDQNLIHLEIEHTFDDVATPDVLLVPGGPGSRRLAVAGTPIVDWVQSAHRSTTWTTSVCTGSLILGAAGVLDGLKATTHWASYDALATFGALPSSDRVVVDGKVITGAGVSAGIDMALRLVVEMFGIEMAQAVQLGIEYDPQPPTDAGSVAKAPPEIVELVRAVVAEF